MGSSDKSSNPAHGEETLTTLSRSSIVQGIKPRNQVASHAGGTDGGRSYRDDDVRRTFSARANNVTGSRTVPSGRSTSWPEPSRPRWRRSRATGAARAEGGGKRCRSATEAGDRWQRDAGAAREAPSTAPHPAHEQRVAAQQRTDAARPAMRRLDTRGKALQRAGNRRQDALPDARRRSRVGCPNGKSDAVKHGLYKTARARARW